MRATRFEFRYRVAIIGVIYTLGFAAFWYFPLGLATGQTTWLILSSLMAGTHWLTLNTATLFVTVIALVCGVAGTALRVWGTAHLGATTMTGSEMLAGQMVVSGPYRHLRNPLYVGLWLLSVPISILMPVAGAIFVFLMLSVFLLRIIGGEESHLSEKLGGTYHSYRSRVPRLFPTPVAAVSHSGLRPRWMQALMAEAFPVGFTVCFAFLAWSYNARLLTRYLIVCFGFSLVVRALMKPGKE